MFRSIPLLLLCIAAACRGTDLANESAPEEASASQPVVAELEPLPDPSAGPLEEYMGRRIATTMHWRGAGWLLRETREEEERTSQLFEALAVQPGWTVCDLGAGNGYYSLELARQVGPQGSILAVDIQPEMLRMLDERAHDAGLENIELIEGLSHDPRLPEASCDLVLMVDVYHELYHPAHTLRAIHRALKPGGRVVLVEFREEDPDVPIKLDHKMSKAQVSKELAANGFALDEEFDELPWQHVMFFKRASEVR